MLRRILMNLTRFQEMKGATEQSEMKSKGKKS